MNHILHNLHTQRVSDLKQELLQQRPVVVWLTGLPSSGKSTIASQLEICMLEKGYLTQWLDGDQLRHGLTSDLGFSPNEQQENIRRCSETAKILVEAGIITICSFISATESSRNEARKIIGSFNFLEVYINCPLEVCVQRDDKNMYGRALRGGVVNLSGVSFPYEVPKTPWLELHTHYYPIEENVNKLADALLQRVKIS